MIWFTLALFVVSFLVTALLAPKPDIENARAGSLNDIQFPRATEDAPIPLVLGRVRMNAPNTLWYGDYSTDKIKEKIKTGLFSSTRVTVGYEYYLGLDLGLCLGPGVRLRQIFIDEESVWTGSTSSTAVTTGSISAKKLFGGYKEGGGWVGDFTFYPGSYDQAVNSYLEGQVGAGNVPAYRGISRIVFENNLIGESSQLRKMSFVLDKYTDDLGLSNDGKIGDDINPAEAIYQILTDEWSGLGIDATRIDTTTLTAIGEVLYTEGNGCSVLVTSAAEGKKVLTEILRQIDGIIFQDPETGDISFKLIRQDYTVGDLPTYDESDILSIKNFTKTSWEDVVAQVKVSYPQRDKESSAVAVSQDMATANMVGRMRTANVSFPFCYEPALANELASRERAQQSVPLFRMTLEMNRNGYSLRPGDVFRVSWPEYGISQIVMRVQKHDLGELLNNKVVIDCLQDVFAVGSTVFATPEETSWEEPETEPTDILTEEVVEMPYFYGSRIETPVVDGKANVIPFPLKPSDASSSFDMFAGTVTDELEIREVANIDYPPSGTLQSDYAQDAGLATGLDSTGFVLENVSGTFPTGQSLADIRTGEVGILYVDGEWMAYLSAVVSGDTTVSNVYRGIFGSQVKEHSSGTRVWALSIEQLGTGVLSLDLDEQSTVYYKLLDRVGSLAQLEDDVSESSLALDATGIHDRPLRPRFAQIDGERENILIEDATDVDLTWVNSNRAASQVTIENDATETPDEAETYDIEFYIGGVLNATLSSNGETSPYSIPFSSTTIAETDCEVRIYSRRTGGNTRESIAYAWLPFEMDQALPSPVTNGDFETGDLTGWTSDNGDFIADDGTTYGDAVSSAYEGTWMACTGSTAGDILRQNVDVSTHATAIDAGSVDVDLTAYLVGIGADRARLRLRWLDGTLSQVGSDVVGSWASPESFSEETLNGSVPATTRYVQIGLEGQRQGGGSTANVYFDAVSLQLNGV